MNNLELSKIKTKNKTKTKVVVNPVLIPVTIEKEFQSQLISYVNQFKKVVKEELLPIIERNIKLTVDGVGDEINKAIELIRQRFDFVNIAITIATTMIERLNKQNLKRTQRSLNNAIGVDVNNILLSENLNDFLEMQIIANSELIKSIPQQGIEDIRRIIFNGFTTGLRHEEISKQITGMSFNKINNRIKTIARTEIAKVNSQITNKRLLNLGITKAIWDTTNDSRTRPCHSIRDGKEFDITVGLYSSCDGLTIQPGQEINCRCVARPVVE